MKIDRRQRILVIGVAIIAVGVCALVLLALVLTLLPGLKAPR